jgi:nucleoside-diphosphate-sugar epimerase
VTGGLGFIGSHLCSALLERGYAVVCVDRLSGEYARGSGADAAGVLREAGARLELIDVAEAEFERVLAGCDAVIHLAGLPGVRTLHDPALLAAQNVGLTRRIAELAAADGTRMVLASTSSVYGDTGRAAPESAPRVPLNAYAASKVAAEDACSGAAAIARLFTVYGPGQRPDMAFAAWIGAIARDEEILWCARPGAERDFTYVGDAVRGLVSVLEAGTPGRAYNIGGCGPVPVEAALAEIEAALGRTARWRVGDPGVAEARVTAACGRRAERELGYRAAVPLGEGVRAQVEAAVPALALV